MLLFCLVDKLYGAKKAGVKLALCPYQNKNCLNKIKLENKDLIVENEFEVKVHCGAVLAQNPEYGHKSEPLCFRRKHKDQGLFFESVPEAHCRVEQVQNCPKFYQNLDFYLF